MCDVTREEKRQSVPVMLKGDALPLSSPKGKDCATYHTSHALYLLERIGLMKEVCGLLMISKSQISFETGTIPLSDRDVC